MEPLAVYMHESGKKRVLVFPDDDMGMQDLFGDEVEIVYRDTARNVLGNKAVDDPVEYAEEHKGTHWVFPVYAYVHGAVALSLAPFSCPWDSGQSGFILIPKDWHDDEATARRSAEAMLDEATAILNGEVFNLALEHKCECCDEWSVSGDIDETLGGVVGWDNVAPTIAEYFGEGFEGVD